MKREARKMPKERLKQDFTVPITVTQLGSSKDPCFGKHYSIKAKECKMCGDFEACSIQSITKLHSQSEKQENLSKFKDIEEADLIDTQNNKIGTMMKRRAEKNDGWCTIIKLLPKLREVLNLTEVENPNIIQRCIKSGTDIGLTFNSKLTKYKI